MPPENLTPAMRQYMEVKADHPGAIVLFQMGDFYELFWEDAEAAAEILDLTLTSRSKSSDPERIPMAGFPLRAADDYLRRLVRAGRRCVVVDQVEDPKAARGLVKREITRIVTPGTVLDEGSLEARANNYVAALQMVETAARGRAVEYVEFGFATLDVSTGEFRATELDGLDAARDEAVRVAPAELVVPETWKDREELAALRRALERCTVTFAPDFTFDLDEATRVLTERLEVRSLDGFGFADAAAAVRAAGALLQYAADTQRAELGHVRRLQRYWREDFMVLDDATARNLELERTMIGGERRGSLLGLLDRTVTPMGARLLRQWMRYPLLDLDQIAARHEGVAELVASPLRATNLRERAQGVRDLERLIARTTLGSANARDLVALRRSLEALPGLKTALDEAMAPILAEIREAIDPLSDLAGRIAEALVDEPPVSIREGGLIREGHDAGLDEIRAVARDGKQVLARLEAAERERTGIASLKIRYNRVFGYYIEVTKANLRSVPDDYMRKQTLANAERFITPALKEWEEKILGAEERQTALEAELFERLRAAVAAEGARVLATAAAVARLDVLGAFAMVATERNYCRPEVDESETLHVVEGRHPVVEAIGEGEPFVPNDTLVDTAERQLLILTGPNMGGKSTYLRQVALIALMAHMGSFVPAREARIGRVDRIFTRVGASDNLSRGLSTFMVEMTETANILNAATRRSLVILDEVGRGTSTFDGVSIAWAVAEYLTDRVHARTLFATHYHELTDLALTHEGVANLSVAVREWNDRIVFLRRIVEGPSPASYGIQVARLAGLPRELIERAKAILRNLETGEFTDDGSPRIAGAGSKRRGDRRAEQLSLFAPKAHDPLRDEVERLDVMTMTPIEALAKLQQLKDLLKG